MSIAKLLTPDDYLVYPSGGKGTTQQSYQDYIINQNAVLADLANAARLWQPGAELATNEIIRSPSMPANTAAKVTTPGITGTLEPTWAEQGASVTDNGVVYMMIRHCQEAATADEGKAGTDTAKYVTPAVLKQVLQAYLLSIYPVGYVYTSTVSTSPSVLFGGTWAAMEPGRVLVSAGTASTGTVYTAGATGGEETHQLSVSEMPSHGHDGSTDTQGSHTHGFHWNGAANRDPNYDVFLTGHDVNTWYTSAYSMDAAGAHSHNITVNNSGNSQAHNTMQPYIVVYMWRRTA